MYVRSIRSRLLFFALVVASISGGTYMLAGSNVIVGKAVPKSERIPVTQVSHNVWNSLLQKYVDSRGMVDYSAWKSSPDDLMLLDRYIDSLSTVSLATSRDKESMLAFWINAYNALTIKGILREYPTSSIRNHTARFLGYNIWKDLKLRIDDMQISLDGMEHEHLRKMGEPRIHFAIVCASIGCPRLLNEAYVAARLDQQLTLNAQAFFADPTKFVYDSQRKLVSLSPILNWFGSDFGSNRAEQLKTIAPYVPEGARAAVASGTMKVGFLDYDWNLNDQKTAR